jgi:hypothetical protein
MADLHQELRGYGVVEEPYLELLDEGHIFADRPSVEDFLAQLERSIAQVTSDRAPDVLYDRCPTDFLAYLTALQAEDSVRDWIASTTHALSTLDLIVFVPIEQPDRIASAAGSGRLRRNVDVVLREILLEDSYGFCRPVISIHGSAAARVSQVVAAVQQRHFRNRAGAV